MKRDLDPPVVIFVAAVAYLVARILPAFLK